MNLPRFPLRVSEDGRRLMQADGRPFFYLGDTAWELFHRLTREEAAHYLEVRAGQGFNVIQAVILAEFDGLKIPNAYGHLPLVEMDPRRPNEAYFEHVDWILRKGMELGLTWGLLPTWGDKWNILWGKGPEVFDPENAEIFGKWLGNRYREIPLIWILGGDRPVQNETHLAVLRAMAEGLKKGDGKTHLKTLHPSGCRSSANWVHHEPWLDFNMLQSGHTSQVLDNHRMVTADYILEPAKPCLDAEPPYENHPDINFGHSGPAPYFDDRVVRRTAYQAVFAGALGHAYGCHDIWQFYGEGREPHNRARTFWPEALHLPGAQQMRHLRHLMEQVPFAELVPDHTLVSALPSGEPALALRAKDGRTALFYFATAGTRTLKGGALAGESLAGYWFDPRSGEKQEVSAFRKTELMEWATPSGGQDWVLVLTEKR